MVQWLLKLIVLTDHFNKIKDDFDYTKSSFNAHSIQFSYLKLFIFGIKIVIFYFISIL
jgi:hypothetical protein